MYMYINYKFPEHQLPTMFLFFILMFLWILFILIIEKTLTMISFKNSSPIIYGCHKVFLNKY